MQLDKNFVVSVYQLIKYPGTSCTKSIVAQPEETWQAGLFAIEAPVRVEATLQSTSEGILAKGVVASAAVGECGWCLRPIHLPLEVEFLEMIAYDLEEACEYQVSGERIDLAPLCRDYLLSSLPFSSVCAEDCPGRSRLQAAETDEIDPRWSALLEYKTRD